MVRVKTILGVATVLLALKGGHSTYRWLRPAEPDQPPAKVYTIEANRVSPYFKSSEERLQFLGGLLNKPAGIPYANLDGEENDILVTGRIQKLRDNIFYGNFQDGDVIFEGKKRIYKTTLKPDEREKLFKMMGVRPGNDSIIYNCREVRIKDNDLIISDLYRIGVYGLSESQVNAIDETICRGQHNVLAIRDWSTDASEWTGNPPVRGQKTDTFVNIRADSRYVHFSVRDHAGITDERSKAGDSSITFFDDRTEFKGKTRSKKYLHGLGISSTTPPDIVSYRRRDGKSYTNFRMNPPFTVEKTYRARSNLPGGGRR